MTTNNTGMNTDICSISWRLVPIRMPRISGRQAFRNRHVQYFVRSIEASRLWRIIVTTFSSFGPPFRMLIASCRVQLRFRGNVVTMRCPPPPPFK